MTDPFTLWHAYQSELLAIQLQWLTMCYEFWYGTAPTIRLEWK